MVRSWLLPAVYHQLASRQVGYWAELRPAVPIFIRFTGIDYDGDDDAGQKLDAYIRWVQAVLAESEGVLLEVTIGDKGSYLYAAYGIPMAHEDDPARVVAAALRLRDVPLELSFIRDIQIGITTGQVRAGAYGADSRRTFGMQGNEINMAARLMSKASPGQIRQQAHRRSGRHSCSLQRTRSYHGQGQQRTGGDRRSDRRAGGGRPAIRYAVGGSGERPGGAGSHTRPGGSGKAALCGSRGRRVWARATW